MKVVNVYMIMISMYIMISILVFSIIQIFYSIKYTTNAIDMGYRILISALWLPIILFFAIAVFAVCVGTILISAAYIVSIIRRSIKYLYFSIKLSRVFKKYKKKRN